MNGTAAQSRREFLRVTALAGGGLLIAVAVPGVGRLAEAAPVDATFAPNAFIRITPDGEVTVVVGYSEMGQGVLTAVPMLVAEELDADWSRVHYEQAPADPVYKNPIFGMQGTGGSTTVRASWQPMREAGATARAMLIGAAAKRWGVSPADCRGEAGHVVHAGGKSLPYGALASEAARQPVPAQVKLKDPRDFRIIGKSLHRLDTPLKINGSGRFGIDVRVPGGYTAVLARPPVPGAKALHWNAERAKSMAGVRAVVEVPGGIAAVADGYWNAKKARDALDVQWDLGANTAYSSEDIRRSFAARAQHPGLVARHDGDVAAAMHGPHAAKRLEAVYEVPYLAHACMEPMNATASVTADGITIWGGVQAPGAIQQALAAAFHLQPGQIRVTTTLLGGGFGRRFGLDFVFDAAFVSKAIGAPVHVMYPREDDMRAQFYRPAALLRFEGALDAQGAPLALRMNTVCASIAKAAHMPLPDGIDSAAVEGLTAFPYRAPNVQVEWSESEPPYTVWFWRSVGHSQNIFFVEGLVDEMAIAAGKDPYEYRRELLGGAPRYRAVLELAARKAGWSSPPPAGRYRGIAVAESFGSYVAEVAEVSVGDDGTVKVHRVVCAVDCGRVVNPRIVERQMESAIVYGLSAALYGRITIEHGRVRQGNFNDYPVLRMREMPRVEVYILPSTENPGGVGEPGLPPLAPAVVNAIHAATGKRLRALPIDTNALKRT
ncbi:MAG TPA: xanthine dehydrogenase family protein molybdopterin-binding subunit [Steroidobacteraceae bacterium]|nr:xanthine dehydrogenase family protein molybdopterin-binding subunit [Steroidobacteraceae bacterium]